MTMFEPNYELENQKEHIDIGVVLFWDKEKEQLLDATLELFGNGYDITIYGNNESQYTMQCAISKPSYKFLKYADDDKNKVIANVNDEMFLLDEQQFDQIKIYYDNLDDNTLSDWDANESNPYFSENDEAYYVYEALLEEPQNIRIRIKLIAVLLDEIRNMERSETFGDLLKYMALMEESLTYLLSLKNGRDKSLCFTQILCLSQLGMLFALKGEIDNAIKYWYKAVENAAKSSAKENYTFKNLIGANVLNIICFLNFLGEDTLAFKLRLRFTNEISFYVKNAISINEATNKELEAKPEFEANPLYRELLLKRKTQVHTLTKDNNDDIFILTGFDSDEYETFFSEDSDPDFDDYSAAYTETISIVDELANGKYSPIFEKEESERKKQLLRIKAYL